MVVPYIMQTDVKNQKKVNFIKNYFIIEGYIQSDKKCQRYEQTDKGKNKQTKAKANRQRQKQTGETT